MCYTVVRPTPFVGKSSRGIRTVRAIHARLDPRGEYRRLAARVSKLDTNLGRLRVHEIDDPLERRDLRVRPEPRILRGDAALRQDRGHLHENSAGTPCREALHARHNSQVACPVSAWALSCARGKKVHARLCVRGASPSRDRCPSCSGLSEPEIVGIHQCVQSKYLAKWATLLTTKIRFANVTPRIVNGVNSGGRSLLRGKVSWGRTCFERRQHREHISGGVGPTGDKAVPMLGSLRG